MRGARASEEGKRGGRATGQVKEEEGDVTVKDWVRGSSGRRRRLGQVREELHRCAGEGGGPEPEERGHAGVGGGCSEQSHLGRQPGCHWAGPPCRPLACRCTGPSRRSSLQNTARWVCLRFHEKGLSFPLGPASGPGINSKSGTCSREGRLWCCGPGSAE